MYLTLEINVVNVSNYLHSEEQIHTVHKAKQDICVI